MEKHALFTVAGVVAREVNVNAAPAELTAQIAKGEKIVSSDQHVDGPGMTGD